MVHHPLPGLGFSFIHPLLALRTAALLGPRVRPDTIFQSYLLSISYPVHILTHYDLSVECGNKSRPESNRSHAPGSGATHDNYYTGSANSSTTATMAAETIGTARDDEVGTGPSQPPRNMTQHERDDLLRGVGSQFDAVPGVVRGGGRGAAGRGDH